MALGLLQTLILRQRQCEPEGRPVTGMAFNPDFSVHTLDQAARQIQAKAVTIGLLVIAGIEAIEFLEEAGLIFHGDARAIIAD